MKIKVTTIYVDDQDKALAFYTDVLGFRFLRRAGFGPQHNLAYKGAMASWKQFMARLEQVVADLD